MKYTTAAVLLVFSLFALFSCGDDSDENDTGELGLSGSPLKLLLSDLDEDQRLQNCQWRSEILSSAVANADCTINETYSTPISVEECADTDENFQSCTVEDYESCLVAICGDICSEEFPPDACTPLRECLYSANPPSNLCSSVFGCAGDDDGGLNWCPPTEDRCGN